MLDKCQPCKERLKFAVIIAALSIGAAVVFLGMLWVWVLLLMNMLELQ